MTSCFWKLELNVNSLVSSYQGTKGRTNLGTSLTINCEKNIITVLKKNSFEVLGFDYLDNLKCLLKEVNKERLFSIYIFKEKLKVNELLDVQ